VRQVWQETLRMPPEKVTIPPGLPVYKKPVDRIPATVPESVKTMHPHGILNKALSRMLLTHKKLPNTLKGKHAPKVLKKTKKPKVL